MIVNCSYRDAISSLDDGSVQLVWTDPPFGTGEKQKLDSTSGTRYSYMDYDSSKALENVVDMASLVAPKMTPTGVLAICLDYRIVHEAKVAIQETGLYGFNREIIYHFELGATSRNWWTNKHNTILLWGFESPLFQLENVPTVERKSVRGVYNSAMRRVNSVWSITMGPSDTQRTGYPNQKPLSLIEPFVLVHTRPNDLVFDPFAGSGSTGVAAKNHGRRFVMCDVSAEACTVMRGRGLGDS